MSYHFRLTKYILFLLSFKKEITEKDGRVLQNISATATVRITLTLPLIDTSFKLMKSSFCHQQKISPAECLIFLANDNTTE